MLSRNSLSTLPAGVFDELTALTWLRLEDNPGAPFSPTADALPDDGEVSFVGGTVTLDGSGSDGGPWGTNVTYSWAASGATVTFDDAASATPVVTIPALADGAELTFTLTVTGRGGANTSAGTAPDTDTATVTAVFDSTLGICGRTEQVRDAIVALVSGAINCALVTDTHLGAITGTLDLRSDGITALAAGDFDGLTALTVLNLRNNSLSTLPAGVFDELTALTNLNLWGNSLSTLPAGVFDELTALTTLGLRNNSLSTLPAGVFEELTALTTLRLDGNPGAPFSPTADALPDDGTVPASGGTVTLDGSGSDGGPWGTNVTYSWALTAPASGVTVTFDDAASATPVVTIPALADGTELTFTLTVTGRATNTSRGTAPDTDTATVTVAAFDPTAGICGRTEAVRDNIVRRLLPNLRRHRLRRCHRRPSRRHHRHAGSEEREHHRPRGGGFRRADRADVAESDKQLSVHASRRGVRRADRADGAVSGLQRSDHASRRGVRRADRADDAVAGLQRSVHASRRRVRRVDRADDAGSAKQSRGALLAHRGCPAR